MTLPSNAARAPQPHASLFNLGQPIDTPAEQFAGWLPYSAYLPAEKIFVNRDSMGFMLELMPQSGADDRMAEVLVSLYANCQPGTGIQFHLFASPHVRAQLRQYANLRVEDEDQAEKAQQWGRPARNDNLFRKLAPTAGTPAARGTAVADRGFSLRGPGFSADAECGICGGCRRSEPA